MVYFVFKGGIFVSYIKSVIPKDDFKIEVQIDNDCTIILSLKSRLETVRFSLLSKEKFFCLVTTDGNYIRWLNKVEISISELFLMVQK